MLDEDVHVQDCHLLGIDADSRLGEAERAWRNLKAIYAEGSLATYGLIEEAGRQEKLEQLEGAFGRIARRLSRPAPEQRTDSCRLWACLPPPSTNGPPASW